MMILVLVLMMLYSLNKNMHADQMEIVTGLAEQCCSCETTGIDINNTMGIKDTISISMNSTIGIGNL